jgi:lipid-A-disaccharide synthase
MKYFLIAGEASGDLHASHLIQAIKRHDSEAQFCFLGGDLMSAAAGVAPIVDYRQMAYMGFSAVLRNLGTIRHNLDSARRALREFAPDCLILIDYPSFNLKVAKTAKKLGIKTYYYISPKVWAWKEYRVRSIKRLIDHMYVIFPFEVDYYRQRHDYDVTYVGNPSVEEIDHALGEADSRADFLRRYKLRDRRIIAIMPGSRRGEIRANLGVMTRAMRHFPQYLGVIAGAPGIDDEFYAGLTDLKVVRNDTFNLLAHSYAALVTSGTATLETALAGVPQVACYRANGSRLSYEIMKRLLHVDFVTLPNLIAGQRIIDERLLHECTPETIFDSLAAILPDGEPRAKMLDGYRLIRERLGTGNAADTTARDIIARLAK